MHIFGVIHHSAEQRFKRLRKEKEKSCVVDVTTNRQMERTPQKCFRCGSEDHMIKKCPKQVCFNEKVHCSWNNSKNNGDCEIYASMAQISSNDERKIDGKTEN